MLARLGFPSTPSHVSGRPPLGGRLSMRSVICPGCLLPSRVAAALLLSGAAAALALPCNNSPSPRSVVVLKPSENPVETQWPAPVLRTRTRLHVPAARPSPSHLASADTLPTSFLQVQLVEAYLNLLTDIPQAFHSSPAHNGVPVTRTPPKSLSRLSHTLATTLEAPPSPRLHPPPIVRRIRHPKVRRPQHPAHLRHILVIQHI